MNLPTEEAQAGTQLDFKLPEVVRLAWASDEVRKLREPIIRKVKRMWTEIEWRSVSHQVRRCALCMATAEDAGDLVAAAARRGLKTLPLRVEERKGLPGSATLLLHVAVGRKRDIREFKAAWIHKDHDTMGDLLGYPACCRRFYRRVFVEQRLTDPVWAIARSSKPSENDANPVVLSGPPALNVLLRALGVRAVPHFPCSMGCEASIAFAGRFMELGRSLGFADEIAWLEEMLCWPAEWSALHGIAEVRTPIVKFATQTDATADKRIIRWAGRGYPPDGVRGRAFPFKPLTL